MKKALLTLMCMAAMIAAGTSLKAQEVTIVLNPGWTWISYPSTDTVDIATAFGSFTPAIGDIFKSKWGMATYIGNGQWRGAISPVFYPGYGYHYKSNRQMPVVVTVNVQQPAPQVVVTTSEPLLITAISAMGGGEVTVSDGTYILVKGLCWATHENPTTNDDFYQEAESGVGSFSLSMTGLNISTTYYVRAYAVTGNGTVYGDQKTFTTRDGIPTLTTAEVTNITGATATCGGSITDNGGLNITARGVCWSMSPNPTIVDSHTTNSSGSGIFSSSITGLDLSTTYYVRAYATTVAGTAYGDEKTFTTRDGIPILTTAEVTDITGATATCGGNITDNGGLNITARGVCWSTSPNPTIADSHTANTFTESWDNGLNGWTNIDNDGDGHMWYPSSDAGNHSTMAVTSYSGTGHVMGESYCNGIGAALIPDDYLVSPQQYAIAAGSTISLWACTQDVNYPSEHFGFAISTGSNTNASDFTTIAEWTITTKGSGKGIVGRNGRASREGNWYQFSADLSSYAGQNVWIAVRHFNCTDMFILNIDDIELTAGAMSDNGSGTGSFSSSITGLNVSTTYYVRAYAITEAGIGYGEQKTFTTRNGIPTVTTSDVTNIGPTWAYSGGTITDDGGLAITAKGVCWSISPYPTLADSHTNDGNGTNSYTSYITGLNLSTTYYVRAYVTNSIVTVYGNQLSFTTPENWSPSYVDLGLPSGLLWATCNVGAEAPEDYGDYFAWGETQPKDTYNWSTYQYCNGSYNTLTKYCNNSNYGYNGFTDNLTTLLPEDDAATANWGSDWRMPTREEWQELYQNTTVTWTTQNGVHGRLFTASNGNSLFLPAAGYRYFSNLHDAGSRGYYWSSSLRTDLPSDAWSLYFYSGYYGVNNDLRICGHSVRPVRSASQN